MHPETRIVRPVFPADANHYGTLFGGTAMAWMDQAAFIAATRHARGNVVTVRSNAIDFRFPVRVGAMVDLSARVVGVGRTSMRVEVELWVESSTDASRELAACAEIVLVALDDENRPAPVPSLVADETPAAPTVGGAS